MFLYNVKLFQYWKYTEILIEKTVEAESVADALKQVINIALITDVIKSPDDINSVRFEVEVETHVLEGRVRISWDWNATPTYKEGEK